MRLDRSARSIPSRTDATSDGGAIGTAKVGTGLEYGTAVPISVACPDQTEVGRLRRTFKPDRGSDVVYDWFRARLRRALAIAPEVMLRLPTATEPAVTAL